MNRTTIIVIFIVLVLGAVGLIFLRGSEDRWICENGQWVKHGQPSAPEPTEPCEDGLIEITNFEECVQAGNAVMESWPRKCRTDDGEEFIEDIGNELEKLDLIRINNPRPNQQITSPLLIEGEARGYWFFEASFPVKLLDENGQVIAEHYATAQNDWMTEDFVPFRAELSFNLPEGGKAILVLQKDNPSDLPEFDDQLVVPLVIGPAETMQVKAYFNNDQLDPEVSCNKVFPVERQAPKTQAAARAALEELLKGPTEAEKAEGYFTSLNPSGIEIQSLAIEEGIAKVDFNEQMQFQVGGSCRVSAIRAQITETLKQFPTVNEVIISINGRTEDILQP